MKKIFTAVLAITLLLVATPVGAKKPDNPGKPGGGGETAPTAKSVCIDPGHGGSDPGTSGIVAGSTLKESDLNLDVALALRNTLLSVDTNADGVPDYKDSVYLTRETDISRTNNDRYTLCNSTDATLLVSIHHNGSLDSGVDYTLGLYHKSKSAASIIGLAVAQEFGQANTFRTDRFASGVLIKSKMPSMMSEGYFLTSGARLVELADYGVMVDREAGALRTGIDNYYDSL